MSLTLRLALGALLLAPGLCRAQTVLGSALGYRIRVAHDCTVRHHRVTDCPGSGPSRTDTGELRAFDGDTLLLDELAIPSASISRVWIMEESHGQFWKGAGIGTLAGGILGGAIGSTTEVCIVSCVSAAALGVVLGASAGFLVGGITGALMRSDVGRSVPLERLRIGLDPRDGAATIRLSF